MRRALFALCMPLAVGSTPVDKVAKPAGPQTRPPDQVAPTSPMPVGSGITS